VKRLLLLLAACGDNTVVPVDAAATCSASFAGNFTEMSTSPDDCATRAGSQLTFAIPSTTLATTLAITIDFAPADPDAGHYSSQTIPTWTALAVQRIGSGACEYSAGGDAVPAGSFTLDSSSPTHGQLVLMQYVLAFPHTDCGENDVEVVTVTF
jgi:hypothetical protein